MDKAHRAAIRAGFGGHFWDSTPYETWVWLEETDKAARERWREKLAQAWYIAALGRTKKMPKLTRLVPREEKPAALFARMKAALGAKGEGRREKGEG